MQEEPNAVKEYLFDYLSKSEEKIEKLISEEKFSEIIDNVIENCYNKIITLGEKDESVGAIDMARDYLTQGEFNFFEDLPSSDNDVKLTIDTIFLFSKLLYYIQHFYIGINRMSILSLSIVRYQRIFLNFQLLKKYQLIIFSLFNLNIMLIL